MNIITSSAKTPVTTRADHVIALEMLRDEMLENGASLVMLHSRPATELDRLIGTAAGGIGVGTLARMLYDGQDVIGAYFMPLAVLGAGLGLLMIRQAGVTYGDRRKSPEENARALDLMVYDLTHQREPYARGRHLFDDTPDEWLNLKRSRQKIEHIPRRHLRI